MAEKLDWGKILSSAVGGAANGASGGIVGTILSTVQHLVGPSYTPSGGGEIVRQFAGNGWNSDMGAAYANWCKQFDPTVFAGTESMWNEPHYSKLVSFNTNWPKFAAVLGPGTQLDANFQPVVDDKTKAELLKLQNPEQTQAQTSGTGETKTPLVSKANFGVIGVILILVFFGKPIIKAITGK